MKAAWRSSTQTLTRASRRLLFLTPFLALLLVFAAAISFLHRCRSSSVSISRDASGKLSPIVALSSFPSLSSPPPPSPSPPSMMLIERLGVVDPNGTMTDDFRVGEFSPEEVDEWEKAVDMVEMPEVEEDGGGVVKVGVRAKFQVCSMKMVDHMPCWDGKYRSCPPTELGCLVPTPKNYRRPLWPRSRDEVWYSNIPKTPLIKAKNWQNEIVKSNGKIKFYGGGRFPHGVDQYLNQLNRMIPDIQFGQHTRVALDIGCGIGSFGAFLLSKNVTTLSIAVKNVNDNRIQIALERGAPGMVVAFTSHRLSYPSQAFDLIHCSNCQTNWTNNDGILLLEVNRILRAGGYFIWATQHAYPEKWTEMKDLTKQICLELLKKEGSIAIWRKPLTNECYLNRLSGAYPPLCDLSDDPDKVWNVKMKPCISRLPENGVGSNITAGTARLYHAPRRLEAIKMDAFVSKPELLKAETKYWTEVVASYVRAYHWNKLNLHNVLDMRAGFGGFAVALAAKNLNSWVMNVVPVNEPNTLPVIYDRGLIGVVHDWCEPFDTYPRTYDLLHAAFLFSREKKRCNVTNILLEMDRILRPSGRAYIRDSLPVINEVKTITDAMGWKCSLRLTEEGLYASRRFLGCDKN